MTGISWGCPIVNDAGEFVRVTCNSDDPSIMFGAEDGLWFSRAIHEPGRDIRAYWAHGHAYAIVKGQRTGRAYVCRDDGLTATLGVTSGNQCVGIMATQFGVLAVYTQGATYIRWALTAVLDTINVSALDQPAEIRGTSQGFLDLEPDGTPIWTDLNRTQQIDGVTFVLPMTRDGMTVGQRADDPPQVVLWQQADGLYTVWQGATAFPPQLAVAPDGRAMVGIAAGGNAVFVSSPFGVYVPVPSAPIVRIGRPMWAGFFEGHDDAEVQGNCRLQVWEGGDGLIRANDGTVIARYLAAPNDSDIDALDNLIRGAHDKGPNRRVVAYWTRQAQTIRPPLLSWAESGIEAYCGTDESDAVFEARIRSACRQVRTAWLIFQCYTSNANNTADLTRIPAIVARVARDEPNVVGLLGFSGSGRATGLQDHPEIQPLWREVFAGIPSAPSLAPVEPPKPPAPKPIPAPVPVPAPTPKPEEPMMKLPARCYVLLHNSNIGTVAPGTTKMDANWPTQEYAGFQQVEVSQSKNGADKRMVRFIAADRLFRLDAVLAQQQKYDAAVQTYDPRAADADSGWQNGVASGPYIHFLGPDVAGRTGIVYTLTCVDEHGQLFR